MLIRLALAFFCALWMTSNAGASLPDEIDDTPHLHLQSPVSSPEEPVPVRTAIKDSLRFYSPYLVSQIAVTANGIWNGYLISRLGGAALGAESLTLTWEFLWMGMAMGGHRSS